MKKICQICKKEFNGHQNSNKFCSKKCFYQYRKGLPLHRKGIYKICQNCGKKFYVPQCRAKKARFCSHKCKAKTLHIPMKRTLTCIFCGKEFVYEGFYQKVKYCSKKCIQLASYHRNLQYATRVCSCCGKEFQVKKAYYYKKKFCSTQCRVNQQRKNTPINLESRGSIRRAFLRRGFKLEKCEECGFDKYPNILGFHHRDFNPKNGKQDNLQILCPNCHSLKHKRHLLHP